MPQELIAVAEKPFTAKEKELVNNLTAEGATINTVVPEDIDPKEWMFCASVTCRVIVRAELQREALIPVLGRLLVIAKNNPVIYKDNGYEGFENFIAGEIRNKWGVARSTCYEAMKFAGFAERAELTTEDFKLIGRVKARELVARIEEGKERTAEAKRLYEKAKELPVSEFMDHVDKKYHTEKTSRFPAKIVIPTNKAIASRWEKWCADPDVQAEAGSGKPDKILAAMIKYCSEWQAKQHDAERAAEETAEKTAAEG